MKCFLSLENWKGDKMTEFDVKTVNTLDDKELDHLIKILSQEKIDRKRAKNKTFLILFKKLGKQ